MHPMLALEVATDPTAHLLVGLADDADGGLRVYLDHRATRIHTHVADPEAVAALRRAWAGGETLLRGIPTEVLCLDCPDDPAPAPVPERIAP